MQKRLSWRFGADDVKQWKHDVLAELVTNLGLFCAEKTGTYADVQRRLLAAQTIAKKSIADHQALWDKTIAAIKASDKYDGLEVKAQLGLVPLGQDPTSKLFEFLHLETHEGAIPERDKNNKILVTDDLGIVLVLIPGGTFLMGSQKEDPKKPNFDPGSQGDEGPVHEVELGAYFLSKYEMTQSQWQRAFRANPSRYGPGVGKGDKRFKAPVNLMHPVETVSWLDCQKFLPRIDLILPTEAEWERGARAGRDDQVYAGTSRIEDLKILANIKGSETKVVGFTNQQPGHTDAHILHAPVGSYQANAFGLFDMTGNVWEWCQDAFFGYESKAGDRGQRGKSRSPAPRVYRGGSFLGPASNARVANRLSAPPVDRYSSLGVRPSRIVTF